MIQAKYFKVSFQGRVQDLRTWVPRGVWGESLPGPQWGTYISHTPRQVPQKLVILLQIILHRVSKNVPPLACYNFDTHERILIFLAQMLLIKYAIERRFIVPPQITCASALPGKTEKHQNCIFHANTVY